MYPSPVLIRIRFPFLGERQSIAQKGVRAIDTRKFTALKWLKCCKNQCSRSRAVSEWAWTPFCVILWRWLIFGIQNTEKDPQNVHRAQRCAWRTCANISLRYPPSDYSNKFWMGKNLGMPLDCFWNGEELGPWPTVGAKKSTQTFLYKVFWQPFGSWTSTPKIVDVRTKKCVFLRPQWWGETFDPWASRRKGQECPREIRTKKLCLCCFFFPADRGEILSIPLSSEFRFLPLESRSEPPFTGVLRGPGRKVPP